MVILLLYGIFQIVFGIFFVYLCLAFITGAPFVPSTHPTAASMIALSRLKPGMRIYDLGSGEGRLLFLAAREGAHAVGLEINPLLVLYSGLRAFFSPYRGPISVQWKNFWHADLQDADVVYVYLLPWRMEALQRRLESQLKPGALVVSNSFIFPNWPIYRKDKDTHVYVFKIPKRN